MSEVGWTFARTLNYTEGAKRFEQLYREILHNASAYPFGNATVSFRATHEHPSTNDLH